MTPWERAAVAPIEARIRLLTGVDAPDGYDRILTDDEELELETLRAQHRAILDGDDEDFNYDDGSPSTVDELRENLEFDAAYDLKDVRRGPRAADLRQQLDESLVEEQRAREEAIAASRGPHDLRTPFTADEVQLNRHSAAKAASSWKEIAALARHEAGHCVAGLLTEARGGPRLRGARFLYEPDHQVSGAHTEFDGDVSPVVSAAGAAASRVLGVIDRQARLSPGDRANLEQAGARSIQHQQKFVERAVALLAPHLDAVKAIADVLFRDGVISAADARTLLVGKVLRSTPRGDPAGSSQTIPWSGSALLSPWSEPAW